MPPPSRNHRFPASLDTPTAAAASCVVSPSATSRQNLRSTCRGNLGCPLPPRHPHQLRVLRRPLEPKQVFGPGNESQPQPGRKRQAGTPPQARVWGRGTSGGRGAVPHTRAAPQRPAPVTCSLTTGIEGAPTPSTAAGSRSASGRDGVAKDGHRRVSLAGRSVGRPGSGSVA